MIKNIIFDIGNVIVAWEPFLALGGLYDNDVRSMSHGLKEIGFDEWNREQDRGRSWEDGINLAPEGSKQRLVYQKYYDGLRSAHSRRVEGTSELIHKLLENNDIQIGGCTNTSIETFRIMKETAPVLEEISKNQKGIVVSAEEGIVKPSPQIYGVCLERFGFRPEETLFVDDSTANCEGARSAGMKAHRFTTAAELEHVLKTTHRLL